MSIILFGDTHGLLNEIPKIKELIKTHNPELILYELLEETTLATMEEIDNFLKNYPENNFSLISKYGELFPVIKLAKKYDIPIVGCDYKDMLREDTKFRELDAKKINLKNEERIMKKREARQLTIIKKHAHKKLLVLVGAYHLRTDSVLRNLKANIITPRVNGKEIDELESLKGKLTYHEEN